MGLSKRHDEWTDISDSHGNFWHFNSIDRFGPFDSLVSELRKIHTRFHKPSVDRVDKFIYFSIIKNYRSIVEASSNPILIN